jgi:hypothetical protein
MILWVEWIYLSLLRIMWKFVQWLSRNHINDLIWKLRETFNPSKEHCKKWAKYIFFLVEVLWLAIVLWNIWPLITQYIEMWDSNYSIIMQHFIGFFVIPIIVYWFVKGADKLLEWQDNYVWGIIRLVLVFVILSMSSTELLHLQLFASN